MIKYNIFPINQAPRLFQNQMLEPVFLVFILDTWKFLDQIIQTKCQIMYYKWILKISEYWRKGNIIGWPDICLPNWPKIFPFVPYSLFFQDSLIHDLALSNLLWIIPYLLNCVFSAFFIARSASQSRSWWIASGRRPNVWVPRCLYWTS